MYPPFYIPAHRAEDRRPNDVRKIVKRSQPERLRFEIHAIESRIIHPAQRHADMPLREKHWRKRVGHMIIALGHKIAGDKVVESDPSQS